MEKRTLWIHAGGSKTGSSALQNFFELNTEYLNTQGIAYTNKVNIQSDNDITSGNGMPLYKILTSSKVSKEELNKIVLSYFEESLSNALCSSEHFQALDVASWLKLVNIAEVNNFEVKIIFYIRDVVPFFVSSYDQMIKRHGEWRDIAEWGCEFYWEHLEALKILNQVFSKENLYVNSYEHSKAQLIESFIDTIGIINLNESIITEKTKDKKVNRSLTVIERELLRRINKEFGDKYSMEISDRLIYKNPNFASDLEWNDSLRIQLADRYKNDIKWVNDSFFGGETVVKIGDDISIKNSKNTLTENNKQAINDEVIDWCISKMSQNREDDQKFINKRINNALEEISTPISDNLSDDFDPLSYLLLNLDLLHAGVDPIWHFEAFGKNEGRQYFIPDKHSIFKRFLKKLEIWHVLFDESSRKNRELRNKNFELHKAITILENEKRMLIEEQLQNIIDKAK